MTKFLILLVFAVSATVANAAIKPYFQDIKLPTQAILEHQHISNPAKNNVNLVLNATTGPTGAGTKTVTSFLAQPDVPRNLIVSPGSSAGSLGYGAVAAGDVVVTGTDYLGATITETFTFTNAQSSALIGTKAFKTITSVLFPAENVGYGATWSVGTQDKLGIKNCMARTGDLAWSVFGGTRDATLATIASNATAVSSNTAKSATALDGHGDVDLYFVQNFRCL